MVLHGGPIEKKKYQTNKKKLHYKNTNHLERLKFFQFSYDESSVSLQPGIIFLLAALTLT